MNGQTPQPQNRWEAALVAFWWALKVELACLVLFTAGCLAFLGLVFVLRLTAWVFSHGLAYWW
jgi:hypothetical protein